MSLRQRCLTLHDRILFDRKNYVYVAAQGKNLTTALNSQFWCCQGNFPCWNLKLLSLRRITNSVWWIIFFNTCMHGEKTSAQCSLLTVGFSESYILLLYNSSDHLILSSLSHSCKNYRQKHRKQDKTFQHISCQILKFTHL